MPKTDKESNDNIEQELEESKNLRAKSIMWYCGVILSIILLISDIVTDEGRSVIPLALFYLITALGASKCAFALKSNIFDWIILILCLPLFIVRFIFKNLSSGSSPQSKKRKAKPFTQFITKASKEG